MPSVITWAHVSFNQNWKTVGNLLSLTERRSSDRRTHEQRAAINQAGLLFCVTAWEAYIEDLAREASDFVAGNLETFQDLPKNVRSTMVKSIIPHDYPSKPNGNSSSGFYPADLADDRWRDVYRKLVHRATEGSNFNTPNSRNTQQLFLTWLGLDVTKSWSWQNFASPAAANRLDEMIRLRGSIIHTGDKPDGINRAWIRFYGETNVKRLVAATDQAVLDHVNRMCGKATGAVNSFGSDGYDLDYLDPLPVNIEDSSEITA